MEFVNPKQDRICDTVYFFRLTYYCEPGNRFYANLGGIAIETSNQQEFITQKWKSGEILNFQKYRTQDEGFLILTKKMLPIALTLTHFDHRQPRRILEDIISNQSENTSIYQLKKWGGDRDHPAIFTLQKEDLFSPRGTQQVKEILIYCSIPAQAETTELRLHQNFTNN